ncbi:MAG: response regulator, partial [bacterium]|nr:response regulator [bacterium]
MKYKKKTGILIVDDDKQVLKSLKIWLKNEGFRAMTASNSGQALKLMSENIVDVALVDYRLSKENGIDVAQRLKEVDEKIKIIMLTGFPSYETAVEAMKTGIYDYISKGSPNEKILDVIISAIEERGREGFKQEQDSPGNDGVRLVLFCNHSLLKERLENFSGNSPGFRLIKSFPSLDSVQVRSFSQQIDIALVCAGCIVRSVDDAYGVFPELY